MGERKIVGWVVALMPEKKGEPREYLERGGQDISSDKSLREVYDTYMHAADAMGLTSTWLANAELARLRVLPIYAKRSAKKERQDVLSELRGLRIEALAEHGEGSVSSFLESAITCIELGEHETEGDAA
jgi:hypothetical protein